MLPAMDEQPVPLLPRFQTADGGVAGGFGGDEKNRGMPLLHRVRRSRALNLPGQKFASATPDRVRHKESLLPIFAPGSFTLGDPAP